MEVLRASDPRRVGRYQLLARLGSGGMGRVFLGQSPGGRLVAVKLIRAELAENPDFRARFAREVAAARRVSGIFTAPVVDADPDGPQPWLVTAYVDGESLADAVAARGPLPAASVLTLAAGLAEGLDAIHAAGVVHRDLKPSNVILAADGPRIIDFGISRAEDTAALTHAGWVAGSPGFMSPEQAEGHPAGPPSDIFSLGAVLTFAATGAGPFGTGIPTAMLYRVVHSTPTLSGMPDQLRCLIERCLDKDPRQRPTADQILAEPGLLTIAEEWQPGSDQVLSPPAAALLPAAIPARTPAAPGPAFVSEPAFADQPGVVGQPGLVGQPSFADQPARMDQPTSPDLPASQDKPTGGQPHAARQPPAERHQAAGRPKQVQAVFGRSRTRARFIAVIVAVAAVAAATTAAVELRSKPQPAAPVAASPRIVVDEYFAAINARDWREVWRLGGRNFSPSLHKMIAGYQLTSHDVLASVHVRGDTVRVRLLAYETTGAVQTYALTYLVRHGVITGGHQHLLRTSYPEA
ncbi:MAG TPA: serine/threonine-protein kinase [Streptosporangiaceae bacterium]|nr:serine/threonine-protein kinase [Streptosporangiaceae bacterium]